MKKIFLIISVSLSALIACNLSIAAPHHDDDRDLENSRNMQGKKMREKRQTNSNDNRMEKRRLHEEKGLQRLQQLKWQEGYVIPQHYRSDSYKVNYKQADLSKPSANEQWYKINNHYLLVNTEKNTIIKIAER